MGLTGPSTLDLYPDGYPRWIYSMETGYLLYRNRFCPGETYMSRNANGRIDSWEPFYVIWTLKVEPYLIIRTTSFKVLASHHLPGLPPQKIPWLSPHPKDDISSCSSWRHCFSSFSSTPLQSQSDYPCPSQSPPVYLLASVLQSSDSVSGIE
jgi:hypothetical protein